MRNGLARTLAAATTRGCGLLAVACGSAGFAPPPANGGRSADAANLGDAVATDAAASDAPPDASGFAASLTLSLDPSLDEDDGDDVKLTSLAKALLLDKTGASIAMGTLVAGAAVFDLSAVAAGDYFIEINDDGDDLVPTRIDPSSPTVAQRIGQKLRNSYIGPPSSPAYRVTTYSVGQNESPVVRFSDGTLIVGEQPYLIYSFASSALEIAVLGTARPLSSLGLPRCVGHNDVPADGWLLNTTDEQHHGDSFNADGGAADCVSCHWDYWMKKPSLADITPSRGWCFRCHSGPDGAGAGFVDPMQ